jgi:DNA polymerase III subunit gamma/tau
VFILDEAHMLSKAAGNALLKTLEEPPEHVHFVLATTEPYKLLDTIRSRVPAVRLPLGSHRGLAAHLSKIADLEGSRPTGRVGGGRPPRRGIGAGLVVAAGAGCGAR